MHQHRPGIVILASLLAILVAAGCGGGKKSEGDTDGEGDVEDEDMAGDIPVDVPPDSPDVTDLVDDDTTVTDTEEDTTVTDTEEDTTVTDTVEDTTVTDTVDDDGGAADTVIIDTVDEDTVSTDAVDEDAGDAEVDVVTCLDPVANGGFTASTDWTASGYAAINPAAAGYLDAGEGELPGSAVCDLDKISQSVTVPDQTSCGPARITTWLNAMSFVGGMGTPFGMELSGNWHMYWDGFISTWTEVTRCLGEGAYAGGLGIGLGAAFQPMECDTSPTFVQGLRVDNVAITYDDTCPYIGEVTNGDLEAGTGHGWTTSASFGATAEADVAGIGFGGTYGARIHLDWGCQDASMSVPMSVPLTTTTADPALSYQLHLTSGETGQLEVELLPPIDLDGTSAYREVRMCLPHHLAGGVYDVEWSAAYWGSCTIARGPLDLIVDDLQVVDDTTCLFASGMLDPGLEMSTVDSGRYGWMLTTNETSFGGNPIAEVTSAPADARTGNGAAHLSVDQRCDSASLKQSIEIPSPTSTEGPAVVFWYRYPSPSISVLSARVYAFEQYGRVLDELIGAAAATYTRQVLCMPPDLAGRPATLDISMSSSGLCADFFPSAEHAYFDDFEVTTDSTCPAT